MKMSWRQLRFFGIRITLPAVVVMTKQLDATQVERFRSHRAEMAECRKCHTLYDGHYHLSLITHLADDHKFESFSAIAIIEDLGVKRLARNAERRAVAMSAAN